MVVGEATVSLTTGQQMSIVFLGLIIGGSVSMSFVCSGIWLAVNRCRKKERVKERLIDDSDEEYFDDSDEEHC